MYQMPIHDTAKKIKRGRGQDAVKSVGQSILRFGLFLVSSVGPPADRKKRKTASFVNVALSSLILIRHE